jgi:hypothetical protein
MRIDRNPPAHRVNPRAVSRNVPTRTLYAPTWRNGPWRNERRLSRRRARRAS